MKSRQFTLNKPQMLAWLVNAQNLVCIWGRGTGKTEGAMAPRIANRVHALRRSAGVIVGATYQQILTRTLPALVAGWERMGYERNVHFFLQKKAPASWEWDEPYVSPVNADYFVHWYTGSGLHLVSQDRAGTAPGLSIHYIEGDEAKYLKNDRLEQELLQTLRGQKELFENIPGYRGIGFYTDMPIGNQGNWLFNYEKHMDKESVATILGIQKQIAKLRAENPQSIQTTEGKRQIRSYEEAMNIARIGLTYYTEADSFENLNSLGIEYFEQMRRVLTPIAYNTSILNLRQNQVEGGFYPHLDEHHLYDAFNYSHFDNRDYDPTTISNILDCRQDADLDAKSRLIIATDTGGSINAIVVAQRDAKNLRFINSLYVLHPLLYKEALKKFIDYYRFHTTKVVDYYYDHTMIGEDGKDLSFKDQTVRTLTRAGWVVNLKYIGQQPGYKSRYELWGQVHQCLDSRLPSVAYNRNNCAALIESMQLAEIKQGARQMEKNKKNEKDIDFPQEKATHLSDAADTLVWGICKANLKPQEEFADIHTK